LAESRENKTKPNKKNQPNKQMNADVISKQTITYKTCEFI